MKEKKADVKKGICDEKDNRQRGTGSFCGGPNAELIQEKHIFTIYRNDLQEIYMRLKISEILSATGGKLLCGSEDTVVTSFSTDSREIKSGTMFVPIKGEKVDAHIYLDSVFETGAAAAFTEQEVPLGERPLVLVQDSREALQKSASFFRGKFDIPIVGITGSAGKTTAKEMVALALSSKLKTLKTAGNANSQVGVPITVCGLRKEHQAAVVEMGVSMPGEMERIAAVVKPNYAVVTNIGVSHIEFLGSRENIMEEKLHIADYIPAEGALFVNGDDDLLPALKARTKDYRVITFGVSRDCDWKASQLRQADNGIFFTCEYRGGSVQAFVPAAGVHNVRNALAAFAVAYTLGIELESAVRAIGAYKPPAMRQQILKAGEVTVIDDSYNASPDSMKGAIDILISLKSEGRKIAALADMLELGERGPQEHLEIGKYAAGKKVDILVCVGKLAQQYGEGYAGEYVCLQNAQEALEYLKTVLQPGDTLLVKGSRSMKMDEIVSGLVPKQEK